MFSVFLVALLALTANGYSYAGPGAPPSQHIGFQKTTNSLCFGHDLNVANLCKTSHSRYFSFGLGQNKCTRWFFGTLQEASAWCLAEEDCAGFNFVHDGKHSYGYGGTPPGFYPRIGGLEYGTAYFRTKIYRKYTKSKRDCYEKVSASETSTKRKSSRKGRKKRSIN
eukprot:Awhi_evm1s6365